MGGLWSLSRSETCSASLREPRKPFGVLSNRERKRELRIGDDVRWLTIEDWRMKELNGKRSGGKKWREKKGIRESIP